MHRVLGLRIDDVSPEDIVSRIVDAAEQGKRLIVLNANAHMVMLARQQPWLHKLFDEADIAFCDGAGVQFAYWLRYGRLPHRSTPPQWIDRLGRHLGARDKRVYWLGGTRDVVAQAAIRLSDKTGARIAGWVDGYAAPDSFDTISDINICAPHLLLLCMGMPRQERWLVDNMHKVKVPVILTAGALVDHVAGIRKRPPMWVANIGLEWLVRLAIEPRRLWRRYVLGLPIFAALVMREVIQERLRLRSNEPWPSP